jgi:hypothetical protein
VGLGMYKNFNFQTKVFFTFLSITFLVQVVLLIHYLYKFNNIVIMNIYLIIIILYHLFLSSYVFKHYKIIGVLIMIGILFLFYWEGIKIFNIHVFIVCSLFVCIIHSILILKLVKEDDLLFTSPQFYISAGLLIFMFSMSAPLLLMNYMVIHNFKILGKFYTIFSTCVTLIANLFYIKAFLCSKKQIS